MFWNAASSPMVVMGVFLPMIAGLIVKFILDRNQSRLEITWKEFVIGAGISLFLVGPLVGYTGWVIARNNLITFEEYWNGWELVADKQTIPCSKDGPCKWEYDCDPYSCNPHPCNCRCVSRDSNGNCTSESCDTCWDTCYHDCPYVTEEYSYSVNTTLGNFPIAMHRFPVNPNNHRWRRGTSVPQRVIDRAKVGDPIFWLGAKRRTEAGTPGPVCMRKEYNNYIMASDQSILRQYSSDISRFKEANLLPRVQSGIHDFYWSDKVYFVGYRPENNIEVVHWQDTLRRLNAALGTELQGDLHLVIVQNATVSGNPDAYVIALKAYWQNSKEFGKKTLSKNGIVVVVGTADGKFATWARAFTGMPLGNETLTTAVRERVSGTPITPENLVGNVRGDFYQKPNKKRGVIEKSVRSIHGNGVLERLLWGMDNPTTRFARISMSGDDPDDNGSGFLYLLNEIQPTTGQKIAIGAVVLLLCCIIWIVAAFVGERSNYNRNWH